MKCITTLLPTEFPKKNKIFPCKISDQLFPFKREQVVQKESSNSGLAPSLNKNNYRLAPASLNESIEPQNITCTESRVRPSLLPRIPPL
jgi:hypothetical protein